MLRYIDSAPPVLTSVRPGGLFLRYMESPPGLLPFYGRSLGGVICALYGFSQRRALTVQSLSAGLEGNGYSVTVSAEGHGSVNGLVPHHRVVSCVLRDAQTSAPRSH